MIRRRRSFLWYPSFLSTYRNNSSEQTAINFVYEQYISAFCFISIMKRTLWNEDIVIIRLPIKFSSSGVISENICPVNDICQLNTSIIRTEMQKLMHATYCWWVPDRVCASFWNVLSALTYYQLNLWLKHSNWYSNPPVDLLICLIRSSSPTRESKFQHYISNMENYNVCYL